jgi:hypothetical protein
LQQALLRYFPGFVGCMGDTLTYFLGTGAIRGGTIFGFAVGLTFAIDDVFIKVTI